MASAIEIIVVSAELFHELRTVSSSYLFMEPKLLIELVCITMSCVTINPNKNGAK